LAISEELRKCGYDVPLIDKPEYDLMGDGLKKLTDDYPACDILINNVGGMGRCDRDDWRDCMQKNYGITFELTMFYVRKMRRGRVITISSICALDNTGLPWFNASKAAQISLMSSLVGRYDATFNSVCPDKVNVKPGENYKLNPIDVAKVVMSLIKSEIDGATIKVQ